MLLTDVDREVQHIDHQYSEEDDRILNTFRFTICAEEPEKTTNYLFRPS